jgi:zinc transporter
MAQDMPDLPRGVDDIGAQTSSNVLPGLACFFHFKANGLAEELPVERPVSPPDDGWFWLHFDLADPRTSKSVQSIPELPASAKALLVSASEQQQVYSDDVCAFGVFADLAVGLEEEGRSIGFVQFAVTESLFVSSSRFQLSAMNLVRDRIRSGHEIAGITVLLETIFDQIVASVEGYAKTLANSLDEAEERILLDELRDQREVLGKIRRAAIRLNRQIAVSLSLIHRLGNENERYEKLPLVFASGRLRQRLDWLNTEITALRERAHVLQEEAMLRTADQTNRHLQVLAIVATVFLPASLIAGIFGMNVKGLPLTQVGNGFAWSMVLLVGASALVFWLLKRSGILGR